MYDEEENDPPPSSLGSRKAAYPRHIQLAQFEEVFGMLVADPEPHFRFFHHGKIVAEDAKLKAEATVCVHRVFCAVALLMKADLHSKVDFILRLYADIAGDLTPEAKSSLLKDFFTSLEVVFQLADSIPGNVIASAEKTFWSDEPGKLMTVRELYGVCLTNPQISGMLHSVHTLIEDFSASRRQEKLRRRESKVQSQQMSVGQGGDCNSMRLKSIARSMSSAALPRASLLWDLKAGDYDSFWQKPELLQIRARETCAHALEKMVRVDAQSVLVVESSETTRSKACRLVGLVSTEKLLLYFLHFLVPGFQSSTAKTYEHTRTRAEEAIRQFGAALLSDVVRFYFAERAPLLGTIRDDEAFFSVLLRFACGESSVAVAQNYSSDPAAVLGCLTVHDMLTWLDKDLMLLKGQERCAVAAFPQFFYAPAKIDPVSASASVCEGLVEMTSRKLAGILLETSASNTGRSMLSASTFRDLFAASFSAASDKDGEPGPLLRALTANATVLPPACFVSPDTSIANVIREMIDKRTRRVIIQRSDGLIVGAVRASDILLLLLRSQHTSLR
ncbi:hypothetical protein PC129_g13112 [Phytophthora cactorum]|uniref:CBS domain-containing protein n=1 Tax=Phytophthora cactorum TaxID=29920 RepID=A0A329S4M5_9STRA|nr:hypothetical protein Pcac1_g5100 [Phytophthora cactorum]KAG3216015.1 hypothetical protein PC129_g13112 [Phytophthora cactorum]RAW30836.1 hypothetical protein PC110_g12814 [Phytophthora cactorum]